MNISLHKCGHCGQEYGVVGDKRFMCRCQKAECIGWWTAIILTVLLALVLGRQIVASPSSAEMQKDIAGLTQEQRDAIVAPMQHKFFPGRLP